MVLAFPWRAERQQHGERGAFSGSALHPDGSAMSIDDLLNDPEADAKAAVVAIGDRPLKWAEYSRLIFGLDAHAFISNSQNRHLPAGADAHVHRPTGAVLESVPQQIVDDLTQVVTVPVPTTGRRSRSTTLCA